VETTEENASKTESKNLLEKGLQKFQDFKDSFKDEIEDYAKINAIYSPDEHKLSDITEFIKNYNLEFLSAGLFSRAFRIKNKKWVIKEGRWDLDFTLLGDIKIPLPARIIQKIMSIFSYQFQPTTKNIQNDYRGYLEFAQYFGYFEKKSDFPHPSIDLMFTAQKNIRDTLLFYKPAIERKYKIKLDHKIDSILTSNVKYHNFLPREYQLFGMPISKENKGKETSYIIQEFVKGKHLADSNDRNLKPSHKKHLILMIYLVLLMHMQIGLLPDTKPKGGILGAANWLTNTENIVLTRNDIKFIDTRWFWDVNANVVRRGVIIPNLIIQRAKYSLRDLLKYV
jgi:hypothetical protein